ncbi:MAG: hypothetical protein IJK71_06295 [Clostridia bacterium]|nr:hypothetical protein [Clostridia bacterium]
MKKLLGIILTLCLVLTLAADAFAASKPEITKQPETATTSKKGAVSFSVSVKGTVSSYTWYFVNPETGDKVSGKKLSSNVKGVKVTNPNSKKISLSHVPESMHGWSVYCHINGNGYKVDSDMVTLYVYGMEIPGSDSAATAPADNGEAKPEAAPAAAPAETNPESVPAETNPVTSSPEGGEQTEGGDQGEGADSDMVVENRTITITSSSKVLLRLDNKGKVTDETPVSSLEFTNAGSFIVRSADPIKSWTVNGIRFEPVQPVNEFKVTNVTESISLDLKIARDGTAETEVDESRICKVTCKGCTFTYLSKGLRSVTEGEVPYGASIRVIADNSDLANSGYSINGGEPESIGKASLQLTVTDDVSIVAGK